jgi:ribosomal protein L40E
MTDEIKICPRCGGNDFTPGGRCRRCIREYNERYKKYGSNIVPDPSIRVTCLRRGCGKDVRPGHTYCSMRCQVLELDEHYNHRTPDPLRRVFVEAQNETI